MYGGGVLLLLSDRICPWFRQGRYAAYASDNCVIAFVIGGAATMQIGEAIIHTDPRCENGANIAGSKFGFLALAVLQPMFSTLGALRFGAAMRRWAYATDVLIVVVLVTMIIWGMAAATHGMPHDDVWSETLRRMTTRWCTSDRVCDGDMCALRWRWDELNRGGRYWLYWLVVFLYPALSVKAWIFWAIAVLVTMPLIALVDGGDNAVSNASASCYWGPIVTVGVAFFNVAGLVTVGVFDCFGAATGTSTPSVNSDAAARDSAPGALYGKVLTLEEDSKEVTL